MKWEYLKVISNYVLMDVNGEKQPVEVTNCDPYMNPSYEEGSEIIEMFPTYANYLGSIGWELILSNRFDRPKGFYYVYIFKRRLNSGEVDC